MNQANYNDLPKENQKKYPIKLIQTATRVQLRDSPSESAPMCLSTHTILFFFLINTLLASLLSIFVEILSYKAKGPGPLSLTTGLVARIWCFHYLNQAPISDWEPKPLSKSLQAKATQNHIRSQNWGSFTHGVLPRD